MLTCLANIWSHLLGAMYIMLGLWRFLTSSPITNLDPNTLAVAIFYLSSTLCFTLSGIYHILSDHSPSVHRTSNELDHLGIVILVCGAGVSANHFAFLDESELRLKYFISLAIIGVVCGWLTLQSKFRQSNYRPMRAVIYTALGLSMVLPVVHGWKKYGFTTLNDRMDVSSFFQMGGFVFLGGIVYVTRVPERWYPGTFDLLGQSHNWLHVLVVVAALLRLNGLCELHLKWHHHELG